MTTRRRRLEETVSLARRLVSAISSQITLAQLLVLIGLCLLLFLMVSKAWVYEDAYITFRTLDNFLNGYGLRWNVDERVQSFTHPLWLLLHVPFVFLFQNIYLVSIALSLLLSIGAVVVTLFSLRSLTTRVLLLVSLMLSESFILFSTSGLENPLSYFLFAAFVFVLWNEKAVPWFSLSLITALAAVNRLDTLLLYAPAYIYLVLKQRQQVKWSHCIAGFMPILFWETFSLWYFGFAFPNTKYAKLDTGIALSDYVRQGLLYARDLVQTDLSSAALIASSLASVFILAGVWLWRPQPRRGSEGRALFLGLGILAYCVYVIYIGGGFMSMRFWSLPAFASAVLLASFSRLIPNRTPALGWAVFLLIALASAVEATEPAWLQRSEETGIAQQYRLYPRSRLARNLESDAVATHPWSRAGTRHKVLAMTPGKTRMAILPTVGMYGFYAGPDVLILDQMALTDPLLARLPTRDSKVWRIGHFARKLPAGFADARISGDFSGMDPMLASYYKKLRFVTRGPLLSFDRLEMIIAFNLGRYEELRLAYLQRVKEPSRRPLHRP